MANKIITNNRKVQEYYKEYRDVVFIDGDYGTVLCYVRDQIHKGAVLMTHPLSGSVKPGETPYKSVVVSDREGAVDWESLELIEQSLATYEKFLKQKKENEAVHYTEAVLEDFREIDFTLLFHALR